MVKIEDIGIIDSPAAWDGQSMNTNGCWQYTLSDADIGAIDRALAQAKKTGYTIINLTAENFPLGSLQQKLYTIGDELENGCGFARIRGLPLDRWARPDLELLWMGLALHLGHPVYQNPHGELLREICAEQGDVGRRYGQLNMQEGSFLSSRARTASNAALRFHTDRCDMVGLLCTGTAKKGGLSRIASSIAVHNAMLKNRPDLCAELYRNLPRSRVGEEVGGDSAWYDLPVWGIHQGKFSSHYSRTFVEALEHIPGAPEVSEIQWEALDYLAELADELALSMELNPGDIQFINNHVVYHSRTEYEDNPDAGLVRSLLRIWLTCPVRELPQSHKILWQEVESGRRRGGIVQAEIN